MKQYQIELIMFTGVLTSWAFFAFAVLAKTSQCETLLLNILK